MFIATASFVLATPQLSLAFVARFYKGGAAKSRFELYVSDSGGSHQKLLKTTEEPVAVQWIGHDRLAWFSANALYTSKLSPWKPLVVKKTTTLRFGESRYRNTEPGMPVFVEDFDRTKGVFVLNSTSLKIEQAMETPHHTDIPISSEQEAVIPNPSNLDHPIKAKWGEGFSYWEKGKETKSEWDAFRAWTTDNGQRLWINIGSHTSTSGDINGVMLFEKNRNPMTIFEDGNCVDFWPDRSTFAYCTPRETMSLGKKEVWTSELHVGNWRKATNKVILKGLVWVPSVSIRP